ncbi:MAG: beta-galactosidase GalA [Capsulimonadaceae bacterium]|nr:beta-galactosidase GalA [Capsulimonadaceae bacterium]
MRNPRSLTPLFVLLALPLLLSIAPSRAAVPATLRVRQRIDGGWRFKRDDSGVASLPAGASITSWRWMPDESAPADAEAMAAPVLDTSAPPWKNAAPGDDIFHGRIGYAWMRAVVSGAVKAPATIHFESVDDEGTVYLNGTRLGHHEGWSDPFDLSVGTAWQNGRPNVIAVLVRNTAGAGGLGGPVILATGERPVRPEAAVHYDASAWQIVHLPHDYVVEGSFDKKTSGSRGFLPSGAGWYRKIIDVPASAKGRRIWLDFDGVYRNSSVWLNGHLLGQHPCGYTGFRYDIASVANYGGENVIAVYVDARNPEGWWYEGGGIYRHVYLNIASPVSVAPDGTFVTASVKGLQPGETPSADLKIVTTVTNATALNATAKIISLVSRPDGSVAATATSTITLPAGKSVDATQTALEPKAMLRSLDQPQMYRLTTRISIGNRAVDSTETPFGIRSLRFDVDKGFFLNEKPVKIKGTCNHQDFAGIGVALPDGILSWRVKKLKEMGSNAYRTSHDEVATELLDACDTQGMLVMDETRHFGGGEAGKASPETSVDDLGNLRQQVMRDRNHPSVIMWSIGNEEKEQDTPHGLVIGTAMKKLVYELDGTRPVTEAVCTRHGQGSSTILDIEGFNYNPGAYTPFHASHPAQALIGSETASALSTRGMYSMEPFQGAGVTQHGDKTNGWVAAYDVNRPGWGQTAEDAWKPIAERPFIEGGFVWTGFDYRGEPTPFDWPCVNSAFGIMDMCGFPKDSYYYYQSVWGDKPVVHLLPHWNWPGKEGQPVNVWAFSNADNVELLLNGTRLGTKAVPKNGHVEWDVPYMPGTLLARATTGGVVIATDEVASTGAPAAIRLSADRPALIADGEDASPIAVAIVDANGRVVPTAGNLVTFTVTGPGIIAGVGNGNPSSHEPDKATQRLAFNGLCMAIVQASETPGKITLTATADGLKPASITLETRK